MPAFYPLVYFMHFIDFGFRQDATCRFHPLVVKTAQIFQGAALLRKDVSFFIIISSVTWFSEVCSYKWTIQTLNRTKLPPNPFTLPTDVLLIFELKWLEDCHELHLNIFRVNICSLWLGGDKLMLLKMTHHFWRVKVCFPLAHIAKKNPKCCLVI